MRHSCWPKISKTPYFMFSVCTKKQVYLWLSMGKPVQTHWKHEYVFYSFKGKQKLGCIQKCLSSPLFCIHLHFQNVCNMFAEDKCIWKKRSTELEKNTVMQKTEVIRLKETWLFVFSPKTRFVVILVICPKNINRCLTKILKQ